MSERDLIERLRQELGGIETPMMNGDNLALTLCSHFDNPNQPTDDEHGWSEDALRGQDEVLDAVHAHYAATIARLSEALAEAEKKGAEDKRRLDWLEVNRNAEISHESFEDDVWQVHTINGGRNDREWTKRAEADTVRDAIDAAIRAAPPRDLSQGGQHG